MSFVVRNQKVHAVLYFANADKMMAALNKSLSEDGIDTGGN